MAGATSVATSHPGGGAQRSSVATQPQGGGQKALGGFTWWLLLGLMLVSDIGSALCNVLVTAGIGLTATVAGSIVPTVCRLLIRDSRRINSRHTVGCLRVDSGGPC